MKVLQWLAAVVFVVAGIALLVAPGGAQVVAKAAVATAPVKAGFVPTRFTVADSGTAGKPDVVLIPGLASSAAVWDAEVKLLAPNYRLHVVQVDGFAGAPAGPNAKGEMLPAIVEELHQYIASAGMKPVVVGHSLGGLMTLMLADKYPADMSKMVIVDSLPFYALLFNPDATVETVRPQAEIIRDQIIAAPDDQFAAMQPMLVAGMVNDKDAQKLVAAASIASNRTVMANAMFEDLQTDLRGEVGKIKTPALVLYEYDAAVGGPDPAKYEAIVKASYKPMPNVTLVKVEGSKHFIMYDQPKKMDDALEAFLK